MRVDVYNDRRRRNWSRYNSLRVNTQGPQPPAARMARREVRISNDPLIQRRYMAQTRKNRGPDMSRLMVIVHRPFLRRSVRT